MSIIITVPHQKKGGVANYFQVTKRYFSVDVTYLLRGSLPYERNFFSELLRLIIDYLNFTKYLLKKDIDGVLINTSLGVRSINRDLIFVALSKIFSKKVTLFIHGWDEQYENEFFNSKNLFKVFFYTCESYIVLSSEYRNKLKSYGIDSKVHILSTLVDDDFVSNYENISIIEKEYINLLFLARIERTKGVTETLKAFKILNDKAVKVKLKIAGDGSYLTHVVSFIQENDLSDVQTLGFIKGIEKRNAFLKSDLYILPSYREGMPTTVLEAMAFGLPILTTPVGGILDFFEEGKMGFFLENRDPKHIAEKIEYLIKRPELMKEISRYNYKYAKEHFYASKVTKKIENIIELTSN